MTLWSITRSPLMWGGNLTENRASELALMTNAAVLAVDQNSTNNRQLYGGTRQVWTADVPGSDRQVRRAVQPRRARTANVSVNLADLGHRLGHRDRPVVRREPRHGRPARCTRSLPAHGSGLYRLAPQTHRAGAAGVHAHRPAQRQARRRLQRRPPPTAPTSCSGPRTARPTSAGGSATSAAATYEVVSVNSGQVPGRLRRHVGHRATVSGSSQWTCNGRHQPALARRRTPAAATCSSSPGTAASASTCPTRPPPTAPSSSSGPAAPAPTSSGGGRARSRRTGRPRPGRWPSGRGPVTTASAGSGTPIDPDRVPKNHQENTCDHSSGDSSPPPRR